MPAQNMHVALLRGINVGGKRKVDMKTLKVGFERLGHTDVRTYINSGNVLFRPSTRDRPSLEATLSDLVREEFGLEIMVLVRDADEFTSTASAIPPDWNNGPTMRCDVMFLHEGFDRPDVIDGLPTKQGIDEIRYHPGAVIWRVDRADLTRSGMARLVGTDFYRASTVRNSNTVRTIAGLLAESAD